MKRILLALVLVACSHHSVEPPVSEPKIDPFLTVRVRNQFTPASSYGQTSWRIYALLTGPRVEDRGVTYQGAIIPSDVAGGRATRCIAVASDSIGSRFLTLVAIGDTQNHTLLTDAQVDAMIQAYYAGNTTMPAGITALVQGPTDAWNSAQFAAGRGLIADDPIRWGWDWSGSTTTNFYERTDTDPVCNRA